MDRIKFLFLVITLMFIGVVPAYSSGGLNTPESDTPDDLLIGFFDLRDRETFIQITNVDGAESETVHVQIFDVSNNCNENNFFDTYTPNDTHTYNLRNILTNDGNPSGVVLPENAYGVITILRLEDPGMEDFELIGNLRVVDNNGYEYRTNLAGAIDEGFRTEQDFFSFNFNQEAGIELSDIIMIPYEEDGFDVSGEEEVIIDDILAIWRAVDVDIYNLNETPFSCRNVVFSCVNQDNPLLEALLEEVAENSPGANVASFEYGINEAIPHSKGGELLCPGNTISDGFVRFKQIGTGSGDNVFTELPVIGYVGLNNGNGRGSLDAFWIDNGLTDGN